MAREENPAERLLTPDVKSSEVPPGDAVSRLVIRLFRDETAVTTLEYVVAGVALALAAVAASRIIAGGLRGYLHRIYLVVTLPIP